MGIGKNVTPTSMIAIYRLYSTHRALLIGGLV